MTVKDRIIDIVHDLPDDATIEDAIYRLHLLAKIDRGLVEEDAGQLLTQDEVRRRMAPFLVPR